MIDLISLFVVSLLKANNVWLAKIWNIGGLFKVSCWELQWHKVCTVVLCARLTGVHDYALHLGGAHVYEVHLGDAHEVHLGRHAHEDYAVHLGRRSPWRIGESRDDENRACRLEAAPFLFEARPADADADDADADDAPHWTMLNLPAGWIGPS